MMKLSSTVAITCVCLFLFSCGNQATTPSPAVFVDDVATALENGGKVDLTAFQWTREPAAFSIDGQTLTVTTAPHTDLWQPDHDDLPFRFCRRGCKGPGKRRSR